MKTDTQTLATVYVLIIQVLLWNETTLVYLLNYFIHTETES